MRTVSFAPYNRPFDNNRFDPVTCRSLSRERSPRRVENGTAAIRCTDRGSGRLFTSCQQQLRPNRDCLTASPAISKADIHSPMRSKSLVGNGTTALGKRASACAGAAATYIPAEVQRLTIMNKTEASEVGRAS